MKVVLGVEEREGNERATAAEDLVRRLRFPSASIDVVQVLTPAPYGTWGLDPILVGEAIEVQERMQREAAQDLVQRVAGRLQEELPDFAVPESATFRVVHAASAAEGLREEAARGEADVIAVNGPHSSSLGAFLSGSVARSLVIDSHPCDLLLAKEAAPSRTPTPKDAAVPATVYGGGVRAVFATDHSRYAERCVEELRRLAPRGISHLTVLTAYPEHDLQGEQDWVPDLKIDLRSSVRKTLESRNEDVLKQLEFMLFNNDATSDSLVVGLPVHEAIAQTMKETDAELLILGAHGHGFWERLTLGSVSFHQAMTSPYSLLILRP